MWAGNCEIVGKQANLLICARSISIHLEDMSLAPRLAHSLADSIGLGVVGSMPPMHVNGKVKGLGHKMLSSYTFFIQVLVVLVQEISKPYP